MKVEVCKPTVADVDEMLALVETNMRASYEATWGWDAAEKRRELEDEASRFVIARDTNPGIEGFAMFRYEEGVYLYELQVREKGRGLGSEIMRCLPDDKITLTVFKSNPALKFYEKHRFRLDDDDPSNFGYDEPYFILSRRPTRKRRRK